MRTDYTTDPTMDGKQLIQAWIDARDELDRAISRVTSAECALANARNALGRWLTPSSAKVSEVFCIWYGPELIWCKVLSLPDTPEAGGNFDICVRWRR